MSSILSPLAENVKLWLPFSEGSGTTAYDYSSSGNNGTITGATYVKIEDGGYALDMNGTTDYIQTIGTVALGSSDFTISMWIYLNSNTATTKVLFSNRDGTSINRIAFYLTSDENIWLFASNGSGVNWDSGVSVPINKWTFITLTRVGIANELYVNGVNVYSGTTVSGDLGTKKIVIGAEKSSSYNSFTDGKFRLPMIFNTALTPEAILKLYQETYIE